ncbi:MAG TPA: ABC-2 family transporter protein [Clostridiaceae bacterium]
MKVLRYLKFCTTLLKFKINRQMAYSFSFWAGFFVDLTVFMIQIGVFKTVFSQITNLNGWNQYQMIFFVGTFTVLDSLYMCTYFFGVIAIPEKIRTGKLDIYITKPINTLFFVSFENMDFGSLLLTVPGILMLVYSSSKLGIILNIGKLSGYIFLIIIMLILMYDLMVIIRSSAFWFIKIDSLQEFENEMVNFSFRVPGVAYRGISKLIFFVILPYGLMATIPTEFFTASLKISLYIMSIIICIVFTVISQFAWKFGLRHYGSASS